MIDKNIAISNFNKLNSSINKVNKRFLNNFNNEQLQFLSGGKYEPILLDNAYKVHMKLTLNSVSASDFGSYKCVSRNALGDTDGTIKVYREYNKTLIWIVYITHTWVRNFLEELYLFLISKYISFLLNFNFLLTNTFFLSFFFK